MVNKTEIKHWQDKNTYTILSFDESKVKPKAILKKIINVLGALFLMWLGIEQTILQTLARLGLDLFFGGAK